MKTASVKLKVMWRRIAMARNLSPCVLTFTVQDIPPFRVLVLHPHAPPPPSCLAPSKLLPLLWAKVLLMLNRVSAFWCPCRGPGARPANKWRGRTQRLIVVVRWQKRTEKRVFCQCGVSKLKAVAILMPPSITETTCSVTILQHFSLVNAVPHSCWCLLVHQLPTYSFKTSMGEYIIQKLAYLLHFIYVYRHATLKYLPWT